MQIHDCVSFILLKEQCVLLEQRSEEKKTDPGKVTIPGGHMEESESQEQALIRELNEELSIEPTQYHYLCTLYHPSEELQRIHYYVVHQWSGDIKVQEAQSVGWHRLAHASVDIDADNIALSELKRLSSLLAATDE